uniref:Ribosomal protein L6 n=1 Tax=Proteomonas sulcata TaxID=77928 RepID=A0A2P1G8F2_9CRYP|nr:ribosomal protein L6 [Proteomonas sulcata]AVM81213.1 ribosomal protein L6 [Proteomonas sulcata]
MSNSTKTYQMISNTKIVNHKNMLIVIGQKGRLIYHLNKTFQDIKLILSNQTLKLNQNLECLQNEKVLDSILKNVNKYYFIKLNLSGIGFRSWVYFDSNKQQILIIKIDLAKDLRFIIPKSVTVFCLNPTLILIRGIKKDDVKALALKIKLARKTDNYKGKGIFLENEEKRLKIGKKI